MGNKTTDHKDVKNKIASALEKDLRKAFKITDKKRDLMQFKKLK